MVSFDALCTFEDVRGHLLRTATTLSEQVFTSGGDFDAEGVIAIDAASDRLRQYLGRESLHARQYTAYLSQTDDFNRVKRHPGTTDLRLDARLVKAWPVLFVEQSVTVVDERGIYTEESFDELVWIAGYRRPDQQTFSDFPQAVQDALTGVQDIPVLPDDITRAAAQIAAIRAQQQVKGLIAVSNETAEQGDFSTSVTKQQADTQAEMRTLRTIQRHRYFV